MLSQASLSNVDSGGSAVWQRIRDGDEQAWRDVAAAFRQRLRRLASSTLPADIQDRVDASDMVQQTFLDADQSFDAFAGRSMPELYAWMAAILKHNVRDAVRQHVLAQRRSIRLEARFDQSDTLALQWHEWCAADQTSPSMCAVRDERNQKLRDAIHSLPPRQSAAVRMRHLEGCSLADIAAELSCTESIAAAVLARGLRSLRNKLGDID